MQISIYTFVKCISTIAAITNTFYNNFLLLFCKLETSTKNVCDDKF